MKSVLFFKLISNASLKHTHSVMLWSKAKYRSRAMFFVSILIFLLQITNTDAARVRFDPPCETLLDSNLLDEAMSCSNVT